MSTRSSDLSGYLSEDTIAAIATPLGGAISIVRVSGPRAFESLQKLKGPTTSPPAEHAPRKMVHSALYGIDGKPLDDALIVRFVHPQSYTGEDVVEYHLHGGTYIAHQVMETLSHMGIRQALPGEFSFRAVKNGKMTLFQAQAVADLISASNDSAVSLALEKVSGSQNALIQSLGENLRNLVALGEVGIDFSDQDIDEVSLPHLRKKVISLLEILTRLKESFLRGSRMQDGIRVAFIGLPNAGKSSFFNALLGEDRSIVSEIAGTTRDVVHEKLTLRGKKASITLRLEDTAGLRTTDDPIEKLGIERTRHVIQKADLLLYILDGTASIETAAELWKKTLNTTNTTLDTSSSQKQKILGILTKSDLLSPKQIEEKLTKARSYFTHTHASIENWAATSATTGAGVHEAVELLVHFCEIWTRRTPGEVVLTRLDHLHAVTQSMEHLERAKHAIEMDLFASDIRQAMHALGPLIGETVSDDILGKIFSEFCIGK